MSRSGENQACSARCRAPVPPELGSTGLCVYHFTLSVEQTCAEIHRQVVLRGASAERLGEIGVYIRENSALLAGVSSDLCLSDQLKRRVLSTFLSLMNLRENLERAQRGGESSRRGHISATPATAY
jgi:hypothetical protein